MASLEHQKKIVLFEYEFNILYMSRSIQVDLLKDWLSQFIDDYFKDTQCRKCS